MTFLLLITVFGCSISKNTNDLTYEGYKVKNPQGEIITVPKNTEGTLEPETFLFLKDYINDIVDKKLDFSKNTVINYINNDPFGDSENYQVPWSIFYGNLEVKLNKIKNCNQIWLKNSQVKNLYYYHGDKINWYSDKSNWIGSHFFEFEELNGGYLILKPDGQYYLNVGEYSRSDLLSTYKQKK